jgi:hypothetical protein
MICSAQMVGSHVKLEVPGLAAKKGQAIRERGGKRAFL